MLVKQDVASLTLAAVGVVCMVFIVVLFVLLTPAAAATLPPFSPLVLEQGLLKAGFVLGRNSLLVALATATPATTIVTSECEACTLPLFDPTGSGNYTALGVVERLEYSFGAVSATGTLSTDNLGIALVQADGATACDVDAPTAPVTPAGSLAFKAFEFVAITEEQGSSLSITDQAGLSAVLLADSSSANAKQLQQLFPSRTYESSLLEGLVQMKLPLQWAVFISKLAPKLWLGAVPAQCAAVTYAPLVPALPSAGVPQYKDKGRFYVLGVAKVSVQAADGSVAVLPTSPNMAVITLGVPTVQVPPSSSLAAALRDVTPAAPVGLVVDFVGGARLTIPKELCFWSSASPSLSRPALDVPLYVPMTPDVAKGFSETQDVMTIGTMALLDTLLMFDVASQRVGILERPHSW